MQLKMNVLKSALCVFVFFAVSSVMSSADRKVNNIVLHVVFLCRINRTFLCKLYLQVHGEFNPGCTDVVKCSEISKLAYVRAEGDNDTAHFLFDFTAKPSLVIVMTAKHSVIQVNYTVEHKNSIRFTSSPLYTFASVFNNVSIRVSIVDIFC